MMPILNWEYKGVDVIQLARDKSLPEVIEVKNMDGVVCRYIPKRMCSVIGMHTYGERDEIRVWALSCGHAIEWNEKEPPFFCPNCGAKVVE